MNEENNFSFDNLPERGYLYYLLGKLNIMGRDNLRTQNIETTNKFTPTTYDIMDSILGEKTAEQYCLHCYKNSEEPTKLTDFISPTSDYGQKIEFKDKKFEDRINNMFSIPEMLNGGHIYYLTKASIDFYANGFKGGFSQLTNKQIEGVDQEYKVYRSNQNISKYIELIETKKNNEIKEENSNGN